MSSAYQWQDRLVISCGSLLVGVALVVGTVVSLAGSHSTVFPSAMAIPPPARLPNCLYPTNDTAALAARVAAIRAVDTYWTSIALFAASFMACGIVIAINSCKVTGSRIQASIRDPCSSKGCLAYAWRACRPWSHETRPSSSTRGGQASKALMPWAEFWYLCSVVVTLVLAAAAYFGGISFVLIVGLEPSIPDPICNQSRGAPAYLAAITIVALAVFIMLASSRDAEQASSSSWLCKLPSLTISACSASVALFVSTCQTLTGVTATSFDEYLTPLSLLLALLLVTAAITTPLAAARPGARWTPVFIRIPTTCTRANSSVSFKMQQHSLVELGDSAGFASNSSKSILPSRTAFGRLPTAKINWSAVIVRPDGTSGGIRKRDSRERTESEESAHSDASTSAESMHSDRQYRGGAPISPQNRGMDAKMPSGKYWTAPPPTCCKACACCCLRMCLPPPATTTRSKLATPGAAMNASPSSTSDAESNTGLTEQDVPCWYVSYRYGSRGTRRTPKSGTDSKPSVTVITILLPPLQAWIVAVAGIGHFLTAAGRLRPPDSYATNTFVFTLIILAAALPTIILITTSAAKKAAVSDARRILREEAAALNRFVSYITHEARNPISAATMAAEEAQAQLAEAAEALLQADQIIDAANMSSSSSSAVTSPAALPRVVLAGAPALETQPIEGATVAVVDGTVATSPASVSTVLTSGIMATKLAPLIQILDYTDDAMDGVSGAHSALSGVLTGLRTARAIMSDTLGLQRAAALKAATLNPHWTTLDELITPLRTLYTRSQLDPERDAAAAAALVSSLPSSPKYASKDDEDGESVGRIMSSGVSPRLQRGSMSSVGGSRTGWQARRAIKLEQARMKKLDAEVEDADPRAKLQLHAGRAKASEGDGRGFGSVSTLGAASGSAAVRVTVDIERHPHSRSRSARRFNTPRAVARPSPPNHEQQQHQQPIATATGLKSSSSTSPTASEAQKTRTGWGPSLSLPATDSPLDPGCLEVLVDDTAFLQVLTNFCSNGIKFATSRVSVRVGLAACPDSAAAWIASVEGASAGLPSSSSTSAHEQRMRARGQEMTQKPRDRQLNRHPHTQQLDASGHGSGLADDDARPHHEAEADADEDAKTHGLPTGMSEVSPAPTPSSSSSSIMYPALLVASVSDDGPGVPHSERHRLFATFQQLSVGGAAARLKGTGLGLSLCREMATLLGGGVLCRDRADGQTGAEFVVAVPVRVRLKANTSGLSELDEPARDLGVACDSMIVSPSSGDDDREHDGVADAGVGSGSHAAGVSDAVPSDSSSLRVIGGDQTHHESITGEQEEDEEDDNGQQAVGGPTSCAVDSESVGRRPILARPISASAHSETHTASAGKKNLDSVMANRSIMASHSITATGSSANSSPHGTVAIHPHTLSPRSASAFASSGPEQDDQHSPGPAQDDQHSPGPEQDDQHSPGVVVCGAQSASAPGPGAAMRADDSGGLLPSLGLGTLHRRLSATASLSPPNTARPAPAPAPPPVDTMAPPAVNKPTTSSPSATAAVTSDRRNRHERDERRSKRKQRNTVAPLGLAVLVVDDQTAIASMAQRLLQRYGLEVRCAGNGIEGLAVMRQMLDESKAEPQTCPPLCAVFADGFMPGMNGSEMIRRVVADDRLKHVPVVGLSGDDRAVASGGEFEAAGAILSITKPATTNQLLGAIVQCLKHTGRHVPLALTTALQKTAASAIR